VVPRVEHGTSVTYGWIESWKSGELLIILWY